MSGVRPLLSGMSASAPASRSTSAAPADSWPAASWSGVAPTCGVSVEQGSNRGAVSS